MNTVLERSESPPTTNHMRECGRCRIRYDWRRSPSSSLKMTYCGALCEQADLGFTIEALLRFDVPKKITMAGDQMLADALAEMEDEDPSLAMLEAMEAASAATE